MTFAQKVLQFDFHLGTNNPAGMFDTNSPDRTVTGLRSSVEIEKAGGNSMVEATIRIGGMKKDTMRALTRLGIPLVDVSQANTITISAGDAGTSLTEIFSGAIYQAWADFTGAPDSIYMVKSYNGLVVANTAAPPTSVKGAGDVATIMAGLASRMGLTFENNNVQVQLSNPYLPGTLRQQAVALAQAANINLLIDGDPTQTGTGVLAIWPKNRARQPDNVLQVSAATGMVGWPTFTDKGVIVRTIFNPNVIFGGMINVQSKDIEFANGMWNIYHTVHTLESQTVGGAWFTDISASFLGQPLPTDGG